jgi:zinc transporter
MELAMAYTTVPDPVRRFAVRATELEELKPGEAADFADGFEWLHFDWSRPEAREFLENDPEFDPLVIKALLAPETRPRFNNFAGGIFLNLRGINPKPGMQQDEMISFRIWIEKSRVITLRRVRIEAINDMVLEMQAGHVPGSIEELVSRMASYLTRDIGQSLVNLNEELDHIEELALVGNDDNLRSRLAEARRQSIVLRRYLAPQRDALQRWLEKLQERNLPDVREFARETHDAVLRYVEDLDAFRDKAGIIQDELLTRLSDKLNRNMFVLAMLSVFFLPLSFVTGLLGVNVAGIPLADAPWGFGALCLGLVVMAGLQLLTFKYLKWFG